MKDTLYNLAFAALGAAGLALALSACGGRHTMKVDPVEIKPIHMTVDVHVKTDRDAD